MSCQSPQLRCKWEKNHFRMHVAQKVCPHDGERRVCGHALTETTHLGCAQLRIDWGKLTLSRNNCAAECWFELASSSENKITHRGQAKFSSRFLKRCWDAAVLYSLTKRVSSLFSRTTFSSRFPRAGSAAGVELRWRVARLLVFADLPLTFEFPALRRTLVSRRAVATLALS